MPFNQGRAKSNSELEGSSQRRVLLVLWASKTLKRPPSRNQTFMGWCLCPNQERIVKSLWRIHGAVWVRGGLGSGGLGWEGSRMERGSREEGVGEILGVL